MNGMSNIFGIFRGESLKAKSIRGMMKLGLGTGVERFFRLIRTMVLTRILALEEFGLMAIVLILVNVFEQISEMGIKTAVIQNKRGNTYEFLNATWWLQAARSIGLFAIAMIAAPLISSFFDKPHLLKLLQVSLLAIIFRGFISPRAYTLQKEYKFGLMVLYIQGSALLGTIVTIVCAFTMRNIWALIIGYVSEYFFLVVLSYVVSPFRPRFGIDRNYLKELIHFARGIFGLPILSLIGFSAPTFVLGKIVSEEQLGLYALAGQLINIPLLLFAKIVSPVILPGYTKKQDDRIALKKVVFKLSEIVAAMTFPMAGYIMVCSPALMVLLWGSSYIDATMPCIVLSLLIIVRMQGPVLSTAYVAVGKPYYQRNFVIMQTSLIVIFIYPAVVHWGLVGAALTSVIGSFIAVFMQVFWCRRVIDFHFEEYIKGYFPGLVMALLPVITVFILTLSGVNSLLLILVAGAFAVLVSYAVYFGRKLLADSYGISLQAYIKAILSKKISPAKGE